MKQKDHIKHIGVVIDADLNFREHIHQINKKISQ